MLQNAYFLAKIGADTAENEQHFAEILPTDAPDVSAACAGRHRARHPGAWKQRPGNRDMPAAKAAASDLRTVGVVVGVTHCSIGQT